MKYFFFKGLIIAYNIDILPNKVSYYYRNIYNRIFRVIGVLSTDITLSKIQFSLYFFRWIDYAFIFSLFNTISSY